MELTVQFKLQPTREQRVALLTTMKRFNAACNAIAETAFAAHIADKFTLQRLIYYKIRSCFKLSAQLTARAITKVAEAYKRDKTRKPMFRMHGAVPYDQRILSWKGNSVSILTLDGRQIVLIGGHGPDHGTRRGRATLIFRGGAFYLAVVHRVTEPDITVPLDYLGVDLGIVNIAADSDGTTYSGGHLNGLRRRHAALRRRLQRIGTKSAKRLLKKRSRKEARFARDVNHVISKKLVAKAKDTGRGIALEDLTGIRDRITVRKAQRRVQHSWAFYQLRFFIEYKGKLVGMLVVFVDPHYTSQTCPVCGHVDKANRPTRDLFVCTRCGFAGPADTVAAENIRRVAVNRPYAGDGALHRLPASPGL